MLQAISRENHSFQKVFAPSTITGFIFETPANLKRGNWEIRIDKGDAWVFCSRGNFPVKCGETIIIGQNDGPVEIRRLYVKSSVRYTANQL